MLALFQPFISDTTLASNHQLACLILQAEKLERAHEYAKLSVNYSQYNHFMRFAACLSLLIFCAVNTAAFASTETVSVVLVLKSDRVLRLLNNGKTLREYRVSLGKRPVGHKIKEGDLRTPEGRYVLDWRNENSRFYRSMHISYPNARDVRRAEQMGASPGGMIMIHGRPSYYSAATHRYENKDWTDGCIAVTDSDMDEIWDMVDDGTPIFILP